MRFGDLLVKRGLLLSLSASICAGAVVFYAVSVNTAPLTPIPATPIRDVVSAPQRHESKTVRIAVVDMQRLLAAHPDTKPGEDAINAKRKEAEGKVQQLIDRGDRDTASRFRESREKELQTESSERRNQIVTDLQQRVKNASRDFDLVFDVSGDTLNGFPVIMHGPSLPDITKDILHELSR